MCSTGEIRARIDVVRAWKDEAYRSSLTDAERAALPAAPAGFVELADSDLEEVWVGMKGKCSCSPTWCKGALN